MKILILILIGFTIAAVVGNIMSNVEQPEYKVILQEGNREVRDYPPMLLAEVEVMGERKQAISEGFKILADYIFGNNSTNKSEVSEKMAMTAPVLQQLHLDRWKVRFVMPKKYSFETLPKPHSKEVNLVRLPASRFAVIQFSGLADDENIKLHKDELEAYIVAQKLKPVGEPSFAFYNPPWTLPFLRRNEVMIEVESTMNSEFIRGN